MCYNTTKVLSAAEMLKDPHERSLWTSPGDINGLHPWGSATRFNKMVAPSSQLKDALPMDKILLCCHSLNFLLFKWWHSHMVCHLISTTFLGAHLTVSSICCNTTCCWSLPNVLSLYDPGSPLSHPQYLKQ